MSALSDRPVNPVVGLEIPHESADLHVTGQALYTDDLITRTRGCAARLACPGTACPRAGDRLDAAPALEVTGVVRVLTADDVPGVNDAGVKHDEPLFPTEVMFYGHAVCWVLAETIEAARLGAERVEVDYELLPSLLTLTEAIEAESFQGGRPTLHRGDPDAALAGAARVSRASSSSAARSTSTSRPTPRWRSSTRAARSSCSAAPSTPARPRRSSPTSSGCAATR